MPHQPKIATCCYCGTRAALVLTRRARQTLSCASCGAPLHALKMLRAEPVDRPGAARDRVSARVRVQPGGGPKKPRRRHQSLGQWFIRSLRDAADDALEDIVDEIKDVWD